jgi:hypothetical protein
VRPTIHHRDDGPMATRITRGGEKSGDFLSAALDRHHVLFGALTRRAVATSLTAV